ncbi:MAG: transporter substrate-binding domain-containing protein [Neisseriaceae bacterium]
MDFIKPLGLKRNKLVIGTTGDYRPFSYLDPSINKLVGFDIELITFLCENIELSYSFINTTWSTFEDELDCGKFDIAVGGISLTSSRRERFLISSPLLCDGKIPIVHVDNKNKFNDIKSIDKPDVTVIVNSGGTNEKFAYQHIKLAKIVVFDDNNLIFEQIATKKADVMITDGIEALYQQKINDYLYAVNPQNMLTNEKYGFLFAKNNYELRDLINAQLDIIKKTDKYKAMHNHFFNK